MEIEIDVDTSKAEEKIKKLEKLINKEYQDFRSWLALLFSVIALGVASIK